MTYVLCVLAGAAAGSGGALWAGWWRTEIARMDLGRLEERNDAYRLADTRADLDIVGPVTPPEGSPTSADARGLAR